MAKELTFIDLFAGIGGFRLALERAGHKCIGFCEIDKFARQTYKANFNTENEIEWHDITEVSDDEARELRGTVDIITGGFPCQAFSVAGHRRGFEDTRGTLFFEIARIAKQIQPRLLLLENVKGLLSHNKGETFATILTTLDELGYDAEWQVLNSKNFGVPQNRERVFIVGHSRRFPRREIFPIEGGNGKTLNQVGELDINDNERQRRVYGADGISPNVLARSDSPKVLINGCQSQKVYSTEGTSCTLSANGGGQGANTGLYAIPYKTQNEIKVIGELDIKGNDCIRRVYDPNGLSPTLTTMEGGNRQPKIVTPVLTPDRAEKRQNGRRFKNAGEPMFTLTAQDKHGVAIIDKAGNLKRNNTEGQYASTLTGGGNSGGNHSDMDLIMGKPPHIPGPNDVNNTVRSGGRGSLTAKHNHDTIHDGVRIRRLTPLECFRLQGFPDSHHDNAKAVGVSDSQLYKQAGNAVTVNAVYEIARRLGG